MIYTIGTDNPAYARYEDRAVWLDVDCEGPLDLDQLDELLNLSGFFSVGLRCQCSHWWFCGRGRAADYLFYRGVEVEHLGDAIWEHRHYFARDGGRLDKLEKIHHKGVLEEWDAHRALDK